MKNLNVRFPDEIHEQVAVLAEEEMRSLNAEILWLIQLGIETAREDKQLRGRRSESRMAIPA